MKYANGMEKHLKLKSCMKLPQGDDMQIGLYEI